jgi:hypothetical protein
MDGTAGDCREDQEGGKNNRSAEFDLQSFYGNHPLFSQDYK